MYIGLTRIVKYIVLELDTRHLLVVGELDLVAGWKKRVEAQNQLSVSVEEL